MTTLTAKPAATEAALTLQGALAAQITACKLELPLLPHVAGRIIAMTQDEGVDASQLTALIHQDQAIATHVLRMANSAALGGVSPILSLQLAIARLGHEVLTGLALAASMRNGIFRVKGYRVETQHLWRHSLASGLYAKEISKLRRRNTETAFLCGLLHNIGKPVVLKAATDWLAKLLLEVSRAEVLTIVESLHGRAGAVLAVKWDLPRPVLESIVYCSAPHGTPKYHDDARTALLADRLASYLVTPGLYDDLTVRDHPAYGELNLYPDDIQTLLGKREEIMRLVDAMSG